MVAAAVGVMFCAAVTAGGAGVARHLRREHDSTALYAVAALAVFVVAIADWAALFGYQPWKAVVVGAAVLSAGWMWPTRQDSTERLAVAAPHSRRTWLLLAVAWALAAPLFVLSVPLDTDAQGFGYLALSIRDGGHLDRLAPWHPEIDYLYSPGALLVFATISALLPGASIGAVMMGASHAAAWLFVWLASEFGRELGLSDAAPRSATDSATSEHADRWSGAMLLSAAASVGLWTALMDAHYTAVFGLLFGLAFLTTVFRFRRTGRATDAALAAVTLAAVPVTHPDTAIVVGLGLGAWLVLAWLARDRASSARWLMIALGVPSAALVLVAPWLVSLLPLISGGIRSPFHVSVDHWRPLILFHGLIWPALALVGAALHARRRPLWALTMLGWLVLVVDVSTLGLLSRWLPWASALLRFNYPFSIAWHGPIVPYMALAAGAIAWLAARIDGPRWERRAMTAMIVASLLVGCAVVSADHLLALNQGRPPIHGAFATSNDVLAMRWLRRHAAPTARVLNYPGDWEEGRDWEAHWAPVIAERDCVYFRMQPFFRGTDRPGPGVRPSANAEQVAMLSFWRDPADRDWAVRLRGAGIDYVLVPESVGAPGQRTNPWRWQPPALLRGVRSTPANASYLRAVFRTGGAAVYAVTPGG